MKNKTQNANRRLKQKWWAIKGAWTYLLNWLKGGIKDFDLIQKRLPLAIELVGISLVIRPFWSKARSLGCCPHSPLSLAFWHRTVRQRRNDNVLCQIPEDEVQWPFLQQEAKHRGACTGNGAVQAYPICSPLVLWKETKVSTTHFINFDLQCWAQCGKDPRRGHWEALFQEPSEQCRVYVMLVVNCCCPWDLDFSPLCCGSWIKDEETVSCLYPPMSASNLASPAHSSDRVARISETPKMLLWQAERKQVQVNMIYGFLLFAPQEQGTLSPSRPEVSAVHCWWGISRDLKLSLWTFLSPRFKCLTYSEPREKETGPQGPQRSIACESSKPR